MTEQGKIDINIGDAMRTVEDDVPAPTRKRSSSFAAVVADLDVGETATRSQRIDGSYTLADYTAKYAEWREALRNACAPSVRQAKLRTKGEYTVEIADCITPARKVFLVALITRTA